jgi:hypothetical protein
MVSFRGDQLHKPFNTAEDCDCSPGICEDPAATNSLPSNVLGRGRLYLSPSVPGSPTERHNGTNIDGTTSCQQSTRTIVRSGNPAPSTVADSDDDDPPPPSSVVTPSAATTLHTSTGPTSGPSISTSRLRRKRGCEESRENVGGGGEGWNMCKRRRVSDSQDESSCV